MAHPNFFEWFLGRFEAIPVSFSSIVPSSLKERRGRPLPITSRLDPLKKHGSHDLHGSHGSHVDSYGSLTPILYTLTVYHGYYTMGLQSLFWSDLPLFGLCLLISFSPVHKVYSFSSTGPLQVSHTSEIKTNQPASKNVNIHVQWTLYSYSVQEVHVSVAGKIHSLYLIMHRYYMEKIDTDHQGHAFRGITGSPKAPNYDIWGTQNLKLSAKS